MTCHLLTTTLSLFILYLTARSLLTNRVLASSDDDTDLEGLQGMLKAMMLVSDRTRIQAQSFLKAYSNRPNSGDLKGPREFCENSKVRNHET